jgi:site-specific DNA-methyltransferase (adenine-specific)
MSNIVKRQDAALLGATFEVQPNALIIKGKPTERDYDEAFRRLSLMDCASSWWWGDLAASQEKTYGSLKTLADKYDKSYGSLNKCKYVSERYELKNRFSTLGFLYHAIAAPEHDRLDWLEKAEENGWTSAELKKQIRLSKVERSSLSEDNISIVKSDAISFLNSFDDNSVDLILTDPPYMTDIEDIGAFSESWLPLALSKLKNTGRAYVCVGAYPKELYAYSKAAMPDQVLVWTYRNTLGPSPKDMYKQNWQAILYYKMLEVPDLSCPIMVEQFSVQDINAPDGRIGDRFHAWQKPIELGERFVRHSTKSGDLVIDPFCGTGTFLLAAASLGRIAQGADISDEMIKIAASRGCRVV